MIKFSNDNIKVNNNFEFISQEITYRIQIISNNRGYFVKECIDRVRIKLDL